MVPGRLIYDIFFFFSPCHTNHVVPCELHLFGQLVNMRICDLSFVFLANMWYKWLDTVSQLEFFVYIISLSLINFMIIKNLYNY
jgi:hypothetical protein